MKRMLFGLMAATLMLSAGQENETAGGVGTDEVPGASAPDQAAENTLAPEASGEAQSEDSDSDAKDGE